MQNLELSNIIITYELHITSRRIERTMKNLFFFI